MQRGALDRFRVSTYFEYSISFPRGGKHVCNKLPSISMALFLSLSTISARTVKAGTKIISRRSLINRISEKFETFFSFFSFRIVVRKLHIFVRSFSLSTGQKAYYEDRVTKIACVYICVYSSRFSFYPSPSIYVAIVSESYR